MSFNPRAREGRDETRPLRRIPIVVSIHAPARGATLKNGLILIVRIGFNPRAREGRDEAAKAASLDAGVSIHAPARGATTIL